MSNGTTSSNKPTGTTKGSSRYEEDTNESIQRTVSQDHQSIDCDNPMDTESEVGASEHSYQRNIMR